VDIGGQSSLRQTHNFPLASLSTFISKVLSSSAQKRTQVTDEMRMRLRGQLDFPTHCGDDDRGNGGSSGT
jgi:hypothetical protein